MFLTDDALAKLRKWLTDGEGSLVCFRGPPASQISQRLGELMPVRWTPAPESRFRVQLTGIGQALRWLPVAGEGTDQLTELPSLADDDPPGGLEGPGSRVRRRRRRRLGVRPPR